MAKKHHMSKHEYNSRKKHRRQIKRRRDIEDDTVRENRVSHGRIRERNLMHATHQIRSIRDLEDDFMDVAVEDDEMSA